MEQSQQQRIFDDWLADYKGLLFKIVRAYAFTSQDQEDLFQEIALQVWDSIPKFRRQSKVSTWLYRVSLYSAMAWSKKEKKHSERKQDVDIAEHILSKPTAPADPRIDWLYERIWQLDEIDRSLTLLLLDGLSYREMAEALGISESNVGVKITRIKKHLATRTFES